MKRLRYICGGVLLAGTVLAINAVAPAGQVISAQDGNAPESLLPPGFDNPSPSPTPAPVPVTPAPGPAPLPSPAPTPQSTPVIQPLPGLAEDSGASGQVDSGDEHSDDIEDEESEEDLEERLVQFDIPPQARRPVDKIGAITAEENGYPENSIGRNGGMYLTTLVQNIQTPPLSRWGHIVLRRALLSRIDTPRNIKPSDWVAARAGLLLRMGEADSARLLVQQVDITNFDGDLYDQALSAYLGAVDPLGLCPLISTAPQDGPRVTEWKLAKNICAAVSGQISFALSQIDRIKRTDDVRNIDILLSQKLAGAAAAGRRAVNINWDEVGEIDEWTFGLALATGSIPPVNLTEGLPGRYIGWQATAPMMPLGRRIALSDEAGARGVLSSSAMVDLYAVGYSSEDSSNDLRALGSLLRTAYVGIEPANRIDAMRQLWDGQQSTAERFGRLVLTAYAAARIIPSTQWEDDVDMLIASMLTAGLDKNALRWEREVQIGSKAWAMLAVGVPGRATYVPRSAVDQFLDDDSSENARLSGFLIAGLAGLDRLSSGDRADFESRLGINLSRSTKWTSAIDRAGKNGDEALVAILAAVGMQGNDWSAMTPLHLYHIVSALVRSGLEPEARMIAAEAIARGS